MDQPTQDRYRPIIERRLAAVEARLAEVAPQALAPTSLVIEVPAREETLASAPETKPLLEERLRMQLAIQRIDGGYFGRCIRCCRDLPHARLDREPDALTCGMDCRPRRR